MKNSCGVATLIAVALMAGPVCGGELERSALLKDADAADHDPKYEKLAGRAKLLAYLLDHMSAAEMAALKRQKGAGSKKVSQIATTAAASGVKNLTAGDASGAKSADAPTADAPLFVLPPRWRAALRKDFADVGPIANANQSSTGATVNYTNDRVAKNAAWQFQGVAALGYVVYQDNSTKPQTLRLHSVLIGGYGGVDKFTNTNSKPTNPTKDNIIGGGFAEFAFERTLPFTDYFRIKAGSATNNIATKTLFSVGKTQYIVTDPSTQFTTSFEWIPLYTDPVILGVLPVHAGQFFDWPFGQFGVRFDPEVIAQYDDTYDDSRPLLFSNRRHATRLGPQVGLLIAPFADSDINLFNALHLKNISIYSTYHWFHEFYSGMNHYAFQSNLNYKFSEKGGFGFTFGYQRGVDEVAGKSNNTFKFGLTGQI
jgi:hypothetical protein